MKFKIYKKNGLHLLSDLSKSAFKMASEDSQKNIAKKYKKTWNWPASLAISEALTIKPQTYQLFEATF